MVGKNRTPNKYRCTILFIIKEKGEKMSTLHIHTGYHQAETEVIREQLIKSNKLKVAYTEEVKINFCIKNEQDEILGGLVGHTDWGCFFIDILWVADSLRGLGKGKELIKSAEKYAREQECSMMRLETFSFQAPDFYKKLGFIEFGKLENFPKGHKHYYMVKYLN